MTDADEARRREEERRREEKRRRREDAAEGAGDAAEAAAESGCSLPGRGCGGRRSGGRSSRDGDGCDACDACDFFLLSLQLSALLQVVAVVLPRRRGTSAVVALIRGYQRLLSRFTVRCPQSPSCSAYALDAVRTLGPRRGVRAAAARIGACGQPTDG